MRSRTSTDLRRWLAALCLLLAVGCKAENDAIRDAPDFRLPRLTGGDSLSLADDYDGKWVLMNFWASWCGPCRDEMPELARVHRRYRDSDLAVLGVTVNDWPEDSRSFAREYALEFPSVVGNDDLYDAYDLSPWIPVTLLVSPDRKVVKEWIGPQTETIFLEGIQRAAPELARVPERREEAERPPGDPPPS